MFEEFSSGYYLGRLYVAPFGGDHAVLDSDAHRHVTDELYLDGSAADADVETPIDDARVDGAPDSGSEPRPPLVMKLGNTHFRVRGEGAVPADTLAVPREWLDEEPARDERRRVLLAKREHAERLFDLGAV